MRSLLLLLCLLLIPIEAHSIELRWAGGLTDAVAHSDTILTVFITADSSEYVLPSSWTFRWAADSASLVFGANQVAGYCTPDTTLADSMGTVLSVTDSLAHSTTTYFCRYGFSRATVAVSSIHCVGGQKARISVVATDANSGSLIESNEITLNGGSSAEYAPVVVSTGVSHESSTLSITALGVGLAGVVAGSLGAPDGVWSVPLSIASQSDSSLTLVGEVAASLPGSVLVVTDSNGRSAECEVQGDPTTAAVVANALPDTIEFVDPNPRVYPKDFTFFYNSVPVGLSNARKGLFHLIYIRNFGSTGQDSILAHAWCDTLGAPWTVDTLAFRPSGIGWDKTRCWAPSTLQVGPRTYMFYTGVDSLNNQSIGYAYTDSLFTTHIPWHRQRVPVLKISDETWTDPLGTSFSGNAQIRNPFVMEDPNNPGRYLMYYAAEDKQYAPRFAIGVARNSAGTLSSWIDLGKIADTDHSQLKVPGALESPSVLKDSLTGAWRLFVANAGWQLAGQATIFRTALVGGSPSATAYNSWPGLDSLYAFLGNDPPTEYWQATEHLQVGQVHFFAAYEGTGIGISRLHWNGQKFFFVRPTSAGVAGGDASAKVRFYLSGYSPRNATARFVVETTANIEPRITISDAVGRRVRDLQLAGHVAKQEVSWDGRDRSGVLSPSGFYVACLKANGRMSALRFPMLR